jgi:hypothetical protein
MIFHVCRVRDFPCLSRPPHFALNIKCSLPRRSSSRGKFLFLSCYHYKFDCWSRPKQIQIINPFSERISIGVECWIWDAEFPPLPGTHFNRSRHPTSRSRFLSPSRNQVRLGPRSMQGSWKNSPFWSSDRGDFTFCNTRRFPIYHWWETFDDHVLQRRSPINSVAVGPLRLLSPPRFKAPSRY